MSRVPNQTLPELSQLSLSPLKLDSSLSSISSGHHTPPNGGPQAQNLNHPTFSMSAATTTTRSIPPPNQAINGRPNTTSVPQKRPASNLFIPKKRPRPNTSVSQPHSTNNTPKPLEKPLPNASQASSTRNSSLNSVKSPNSSMETKPSQQPKGINQAPVPIDAPYHEFDLLTGDLNGPVAAHSGFYPQMDWNIFKFHRIPGNKSIIEAFEFPVKLNRKNFKYLETGMEVDEDDSSFPNGEASTSGAAGSGTLLEGMDLQDLKNVIVPSSASQIGTGTPGTSTPNVRNESGTGQKKNDKLVPLKGPDGQPVIGPDGQPIMVTPAVAQQAKGGRMPFVPGMLPDGKAKKNASGKGGKSGGGGGGGGKAGDGKGGEGRKRGGKKTRQVFMIPEATRQLKKEERYPWLWEDKEAKEIWEGRRIEKNKVKLQLLQVCKDGTFRWYPARKQYMFTKLPTWRIPNAEEADERYEKEVKRRNPAYFAENTPDHSGFQRAFRQHARQIEIEDRKQGGFVGEVALSTGGRNLRLVDRGRASTTFDKDDADDADEEVKRELQLEKQERDQEIFGMEGDLDEMEYEEDVADDDEKVHADGKEEEDKEYEERLKREWFQANKTNVEINERAFMGRKTHLGKQGKKIKKMLRGQNKDADIYASDSDDKDPYASEDESDSEEDVEEKERLEKEKMEKEKAEKAKKEEEEEKAKQLLEEKEKEAAEKDKKGKGPANAANKPDGTSKSATATTGKNSANPSRGGSPKPRPSSGKGSRAGSPAVRSSALPANAVPTVGAGNALTAMRATSPGSSKPPPPSSVNVNPATGRMSTPLASGASTPVGSAPVKRKADSQSSGPTKKQKTDSPTSGGEVQPPPVMKKKKIEPFPGCLTQDMVVNYLKEREGKGLKTQTKDAIARFKNMWDGANAGGGAKEGVDIRNKELLIHWIKKVADLTEGNWLSLRKGY